MLRREGSLEGKVPGQAVSDDLEAVFGSIWCELLGVPAHRATDDFFTLGGCSLDTVALQLRVMRRLGIELPMHVIFEKRKFGLLVAELQARCAGGGPTPDHAGNAAYVVESSSWDRVNGTHALEVGREAGEGSSAAEAGAPSARASPEGEGQASSFPERSLYVTQQWDPASTAYVESVAFELTGRLEIGLLRSALDALIRRHANLRTTYHASVGSNTAPLRMVHEELPMEWLEVIGGDVPPDSGGGDWPAIIMERALRPMELGAGPLFRAFLWKPAESVHRLLLQIHHIAIDEWSLRILFEELSVLYRAGLLLPEADREDPARLLDASGLPDLRSTYGDWASRHTGRSDATDSSVVWWREQLRDYPAQLAFPVEHGCEPDGPGTCAEVYRFLIPESVVSGLKRITERVETTLNTTWLALEAAFWSRLTAQERLILGYPVSLRDEAATERMVGYFLNLLPIPCQVDLSCGFTTLLEETHRRVIGSYAHRDAPLHRIVQAVGVVSSDRMKPLFQTVLVCLDGPLRGLSIQGITVRHLRPVFSAPKWDLLLTLVPEGRAYQAEWEYDPRRFSAASVARLGERFQTFVEAVVEDPGAALGAHPCLGPSERETILTWEDGGAADEALISVPVSFQERSLGDPDRVALQCGAEQLTYGELEAWSDCVAGELAARGIKRGDVVALAIPRSVETIVSMLGVLKVGAAYMPLDIADPDDRQETLISIARASLTIWSSREGATDRWTSLCRCGAFAIDSVPRQGGSVVSGVGITGEDPAYVMFTSGSTGEPKAVVVPHRGILRLTCPASFMRLDRTVSMLHHSPAMFDASTLEIWGPLLNGGRVVIFPDGPIDLINLNTCVSHQGVNAIWLTAALFHLIVDELPDLFHPLAQVLTGGDVVSNDHVRRLLEREPHLVVINGYGPTENTTFTTCMAMTNADRETGLFRGSLPIGRPIRGTQIRIVDSNLRRVPIGVAGECLTTGHGLALGYLGREDLTGERFISLSEESGGDTAARLWYRTGDLARWRADGNLDFLGRQDRQVKINGFRIEPGEIEVVLRRIEGVRDAHVAVRPSSSGKPRLLAWIVPAEPGRLDMTRVEQIATEHLPRHMVPGAFMSVAQIPLTRNGKVDSNALQMPDVGLEQVKPESEAEECNWNVDEEIVVAIWEKLLGHRRFHRQMDFLHAGGDSLTFMQLALELEHAFGHPVPMSAILPDPTVPRLARLVHLSVSDQIARADSISFRTDGASSPFCMFMGLLNDPLYYLPLRDRLNADHPIHVFPYARAVDPETGLVSVRSIASRLIQTMDAIELRETPILVGFSFGANVAYEVACQLAEQGRPPVQLVLIEAIPRRLWSIPRVFWYILRDLVKNTVASSARTKESLMASLYNLCEFIPAQWLVRWGSNREQGGLNHAERPTMHELMIAHRRNRVQPYGGPAVLIRGRESRLVRKRYAHDLGWGRYIPRLEIHVVPGRHHDILTGEGLEGIARILNVVASRSKSEHVLP